MWGPGGASRVLVDQVVTSRIVAAGVVCRGGSTPACAMIVGHTAFRLLAGAGACVAGFRYHVRVIRVHRD